MSATNRPSGKTLRAQVYRDAVDFYFISGTAKALRDALAVDPERQREEVWKYRASQLERARDE